MSIKDLFTKTTTYKNATTASSDVESFDFIKTKITKETTFQPSVDFSSASNFAKYGSAYEYYTQAIERIYEQYPYDGSEREKLLFEISSSYLDQWVFENKYPKATGYANFSYGGWGTAASITEGYGLPNATGDYEYIYSRGGMHTASSGMEGKDLKDTFDKSVIYDAEKNRTITYDINGADGVTIEFWLKKDAFDPTKTGKEVILDLWNGELSSSDDYGRLTLNLTNSPGAGAGANEVFRVTLQSGSTGVFEQLVSSADISVSSLSNWAHYALSLISGSNGITSRFYKNGNLDSKKTLGSVGFGDFPGLVNGYIGALQTAPSGNIFHGTTLTAAGKLSASLDDFRFWKTRRTSKQINDNWYRGVGGGTNTDDANVKLGVYYKFNEGVVGNSSIDSVVLDYSGRIANGTWVGYSNGARSTDSAFTESGLVRLETADPIIYSTHPDVISVLSEMQTSGSTWDSENTSMLMNSVPQWIREEDEESNNNVKYLFQIMSNYFDTLHAQITELPKLKDKIYTEADKKPLPFADRLLTERGITVNNLFIDTKVLEKFGDRDVNNIIYEKNILETKNLIYTNIYNNLEHIYKSKGTEKSVRNLLRCFGFDDELIKLNIYTDDGTHYFTDKVKQTTLDTKYINFNKPDYFSATIYQTSSTSNVNTFVSGSGAEKLERYSAFTSEVDIIVPHKIERHQKGYFQTPFTKSSIFGVHEAVTSSIHNYTWPSDEIANFQVFLVRDREETPNAKFLLENQDGTISLTSSIIPEVYDNQRWNIAVSVKPNKYGLIGQVVTSSNPTYTLEFYGVTHAYGDVGSEFLLTASLSYESGSKYLSNTKRFYVGAHTTNFTGSVIDRSDLQIGAFRLYEDYLDKSIIKQHNLDPSNYGLKESNRLATTFAYDLTTEVPSNDLIAVNWNFNTVTGSDSTGNFIVDDFSSGSTDVVYGWIDNIIRREHRGRGYNFGSSKASFVINEQVFSEKKELPEISVVSDNVFVKGDEQKYFIRDDDLSDNYYALEKSMTQAISEEMLNLFSTVSEFSNLIGKPVDRYRIEYKELNILRRLFFDRVSGSLDFDRYTEYFKWIDTSVSRLVEDLFPLSARFAGGISNVIDSHILERNKHQNKFPMIMELDIPEAAIRGHAEMNYDWEHGHSPLSNNENENCLWQKDRKERTDITQREELRTLINKHDDVEIPDLFRTDGHMYKGSTYIFRTLSKPYKLGRQLNPTIHGGINYSLNKDRDIIHNFVQRAGEVSGGLPVNTFLVGQGTGKGVKEQQKCDDTLIPNLKKDVIVEGFVGKYTHELVQPEKPTDEEDVYLFTFGSEKMPINIKSGSLNAGYNTIVAEHFNSGAIITNVHSDTTYLTNDIPMQGPFTQNWVGGHQHRHVDLNYYDALRIDDDTGIAPPNGLHNEYTREEAWQIVFNEYTSSDGAFGFVGADYGGPYPDPARKAATYYRSERAKRPVNIKNIRTVTGSSPFFTNGNFSQNHQVVQSFGKQQNNLFLKNNPSQSLYIPETIASALPTTTHPMTLLGQAPFTSGNIFGAHSNNRQPEIKGVAAAKSSGSFTVYGINHVGNSSRLGITSSGEAGYIVNTPQTGYSTILTGSSNSDFWNSLQSHIETTSSVSVNRINVDATQTIAPFIHAQPSVGVTNRVFLSGAYSADHWERKSFSWSGWLYISSSTILNGFIYSQSSSVINGNGYARQIRYSAGSAKTIYFKTNYVSASTSKYVEWFIRPAENLDDVQNKWFHFAVTHNSSSTHHGTASTDVKMYINGQERTLLQAGDYATLGPKVKFNTPNLKYFVYNQNSGSGVNFGRQEVKGAGISNVGVWERVLTSSEVKELHACGIFYPYTTTEAFASGGGLHSWLPLTKSNNQPDEYSQVGEAIRARYTFADAISASQGVTASAPTVNNFLFGIGPDITKSYSIFSLTASLDGSQANGNIGVVGGNVSCQAFFDFNNMVGGTTAVDSNDNVIQVPGSLLNGQRNKTIISSRFSAPGGIEVNSLGYLDAYSREYSVHNNLNYRNYTVRSSGSGEVGTIKVDSQINKRDGLQTLLRRHMGQFGHDPVYGSVTSANYITTPSFHKIQRNGRKIPADNSSVLSPVLTDNYDNAFVLSLIPQSDFQYSWITASLGGPDSSTGIYQSRNYLIGGDGSASDPARLEAATFSGSGGSTFGSGDFTISLWLQSADTDGSNPPSNTSRINMFDSSDQRHQLLLNYDGGMTIRYCNGVGTFDDADFTVPELQIGEWTHVVAHYDVGDLSTGVPRLWINGVENTTSTGYSAVGGSLTNINVLHVDLYEGIGIQDLVVWQKLLSQSEITELYDNGRFSDPAGHSAQSDIASWFKLGYESVFDGVSLGTPMTGTIVIPDSIGTNEFAMIDESEFTLGLRQDYFAPVGDYSVTSGRQRIYGYAPRSGILSSSVIIDGDSGFVPAINFPTASEIFGE